MALSCAQRTSKRCLDLLAAVVGLVALLPFMLLIVAAIRLTSRGPVFFSQERIGREGQRFDVIKFRTMTVDADRDGTITTATDRRITPMGRVLRRYKLDEYPQLWNVFIGKMSLVGPRPDVPGYADCLKGNDRKVLDLRPGITGPASLLFRDEEIILANARDPRRFNDEVIYPAKVRINLTYATQWSFWRDLGYIIATVAPVLSRRLGLDCRLGLDITAFKERLIECARQY